MLLGKKTGFGFIFWLKFRLVLVSLIGRLGVYGVVRYTGGFDRIIVLSTKFCFKTFGFVL
jgi:hypothetical protein